MVSRVLIGAGAAFVALGLAGMVARLLRRVRTRAADREAA